MEVHRIMIKHAALTALALTMLASAAYGSDGSGTAPSDSSTTLKAGAEGKNMDSITIEGEDRVRVRFERPPLDLALDPSTASGLDWESMWTVLAPNSFDFETPLMDRSAYDRAWYTPRPWLNTFSQGPVARFRPNVSGVEKWSFEIADSRGRTVKTFKGDGTPPKELSWDGRASDGSVARTDLTYSYVLNAMDKAGNKRSFVGDAFEIAPHIEQSAGEIRMTFAVGANGDVPAEVVAEAASRINEAGGAAVPVHVDVVAPTLATAKAIAESIATGLRPLLRGEDTRVAMTTQVDSGGGERSSVVIRTGRGKPAPAGKKG
jgi:hypothetical protein